MATLGETIWANGIYLPSPVSISSDDEIIWSSNTGRAANGDMLGDIIAEKKTISIRWGVLTEGEVQLIKQQLAAGFFSFNIKDDGGNTGYIQVYRGTLSKEHLGYLGDGIYYYKSVSVKIIQK